MVLSPGTPASSTSETDRRDMTEILLKVELNPNQTNKKYNGLCIYGSGDSSWMISPVTHIYIVNQAI